MKTGLSRARRSQSNLLIILLSLVAVALLAVLVAVVLYKRAGPKPAKPPPAKTREAPVKVEPASEAPTAPPIEARYATPQSVVLGYLKASAWEERLPFVTDQAKVRDRMEAHYGRMELLARSDFEVLRSYPLGESEDTKLVEVRFKPQPDRDRKEFKQRYYVRRVKDGYRVDWMASLGLNDLTWEEFRELMPRKRRPLRVLAVLPSAPMADRFPGFTTLNYWKVLLLEREERVGQMVAYLDKRSTEGQRLYELLRDGEPHQLIVELFYDQDAQDARGPIRIGRLVAQDWVGRGF